MCSRQSSDKINFQDAVHRSHLEDQRLKLDSFWKFYLSSCILDSIGFSRNHLSTNDINLYVSMILEIKQIHLDIHAHFQNVFSPHPLIEYVRLH